MRRLTRTQRRLLEQLARTPLREWNQDRRVSDSLIAQGLAVSERDERGRTLRITPQGKRRIRAAEPVEDVTIQPAVTLIARSPRRRAALRAIAAAIRLSGRFPVRYPDAVSRAVAREIAAIGIAVEDKRGGYRLVNGAVRIHLLRAIDELPVNSKG